MVSADHSSSYKPLWWLVACVVLSFAALAYPIYVIRPFRYQGSRELTVALAVVRFGPWFETLLAVMAVVLLVWAWRRARSLLGKISALCCAVLVAAFAILSRVNVYELMFHPLDRPIFSAASRTRLASAEMILAVRINGDARAYPIRSMSYHHIVNDTVGGVPIVATY